MKFSDAIDKLGRDESEKIARAHALAMGFKWDDGLGVVFRVCLNDAERRPNIGSDKDSAEMAIERWVSKYVRGYLNRPTVSTGKSPRTVPDEIIDEIIFARLGLSDTQIDEIKYAHRLSMSAENVLGAFLEEYIANQLKQYGWRCAWGNALKSVDLCHEDGRLIQIKNRSNTENSSSVRVRAGTKIDKWFRVDALDNAYQWDLLLRITGAGDLSEVGFRQFVMDAIKKNPKALPIEKDSPWKKTD